jgi:hypothetical protein
MSKPFVCFVVIFLLASVEVSLAQCRKAHDDEISHGANELVQLRSRTVSHVHGTVRFPRDEPAKDIVVEIFRFEGDEHEYGDLRKAMEHKRVAACVTGNDGKFDFPGLKPGKYLLRAGIIRSGGINETEMVVVIKSGAGKDELNIRLSLGT